MLVLVDSTIVWLQVGEVWDEISRELMVDGLRPVSPDEEALSNICEIAADTARKVAAEQNSILDQQEKENISQEELMYTEVPGVLFNHSSDQERSHSIKVSPKSISSLQNRRLLHFETDSHRYGKLVLHLPLTLFLLILKTSIITSLPLFIESNNKWDLKSSENKHSVMRTA